MDRIPGIRRFFRLPGNEESVAREIDDEVAFHIESRVESLLSQGLTAAAARAQALREFGDVTGARKELAAIDRVSLRRQRRSDVLDALSQDVRQAMRGLLREPVFAGGVVLTLALGLGLNAAMFGITDRLLFQAPAHVVAPEQVKRIYFAHTTSWSGWEIQRAASYADYDALRKLKSFADAGAYFAVDASLGRGQAARKTRWTMSTASLWRTLGVKPHIGRFFEESEDQPGQAAHVVVLSYPFWQRHFGGENSALGRTFDVGKQTYTVIGVAPRGFTGADLESVDMFVPMSAVAPEIFGEEWNRGDGWIWLRIVTRLRAGVAPATAEAEATAVIKARREDWRSDQTARVTTESMVAGRAPSDPNNNLADLARIALWLSGVSLLVLLIACANVINLLLARVVRRRREVAIRMALGVSRVRLIGHFLIETMLLALAGGLAGLALARWGGSLIRTLLLPNVDWSGGAIDRRVLLYTALLAVLCALVAALAPGLQSLNTNLVSVLRAGARAGTSSRTRNGLVVLQATLSVLLLAGAGLFLRSLLNVSRIDKGFDSSNVIAMYWNTSELDLKGPEWDQMYRAAAQRVRQISQVENAAVAMTVPFWSAISTELRAQDVDSLPRVKDGGPFYNAVTHEYFATVGTRIVRGRGFTADDGKPGLNASIVSETMARKLWPGQNPLGKCLYVGDPAEKPPCSAVVGVARNALRQSLEGEVMQYYVPLAQVKPNAFRALFIRTRSDPYQAMTQIRQAVQELNPRLPFADMKVLDELIAPHTSAWRLGAALFTAFGALALLLAALGLYSLIAYNVTQRAQEMSVRLALGARASHVLTLVMGDATRLVAAGSVLGLIGALALGSRAQPLLFHVSARDPAILVGASVILLTVGLLATTLPARRALRADPRRALANE